MAPFIILSLGLIWASILHNSPSCKSIFFSFHLLLLKWLSHLSWSSSASSFPPPLVQCILPLECRRGEKEREEWGSQNERANIKEHLAKDHMHIFHIFTSSAPLFAEEEEEEAFTMQSWFCLYWYSKQMFAERHHKSNVFIPLVRYYTDMVTHIRHRT